VVSKFILRPCWVQSFPIPTEDFSSITSQHKSYNLALRVRHCAAPSEHLGIRCIDLPTHICVVKILCSTDIITRATSTSCRSEILRHILCLILQTVTPLLSHHLTESTRHSQVPRVIDNQPTHSMPVTSDCITTPTPCSCPNLSGTQGSASPSPTHEA
jgi:hypothetical protein